MWLATWLRYLKTHTHTHRHKELTLSVDDVPEDEGGSESVTWALDADSHEVVGVVGGVRVWHGDGQNASWRRNRLQSDAPHQPNIKKVVKNPEILLTHIELGNVQHFASLDHVLALEEEFQRVRALARRNKLGTDEPASKHSVGFTPTHSYSSFITKGDILFKTSKKLTAWLNLYGYF